MWHNLLEELNYLMVKYRFRPKKQLSQHFLIDEALIRRMVEYASLEENDIVLEIGAGTGFLTRELKKHAKVIAVEQDGALCQVLRKHLSQENLTVIEGDFLKVKLPVFNKVVASPPYHISKEIMLRIFQHGFDTAVLLFQLEFVEKLMAEAGFVEYGVLSTLREFYCKAQTLEQVQPEAFFPVPQTASQVVRLKFREERKSLPLEERRAFQSFLIQLFRFKNKSLQNAAELTARFMDKRQGTRLIECTKNSEFRYEKVGQLSSDVLYGLFKAVAMGTYR